MSAAITGGATEALSSGNVERAATGTLPRFELKATRLTDKRPRAEFS